MGDTIKWHASHNVEVSDGGRSEKCIRCGFYGMAAPFKGHAEEKCQGPSPLLGRTGKRVFIEPDQMGYFMERRNIVSKSKFWKKEWCQCEVPISVGYSLARYEFVGISCIACDRPGFAGYQHCHCATCGAICQTG